jgi:ATP-dependent helicase/nuclease subunit A
VKDGAFTARAVSGRFGAAFRKLRPDIDGHFTAEAERLIALAGKLTAARTLAATEALLVVGDAILDRYAQGKRHSGQLDFGDLIVKARNLLSRADAAAWVLHKLDARIDHILVDEAQDTSPDQWAIVRALAADFFAGEGVRRGERTIFAVGDDKQSIFGFQGAAPHMLSDMQRFFDRVVRDADRRFVRVPLALSFRSTTEVLDGVDKVFGDALRDRVTASGYESHSAHRLHEPGRIVLLPRRVRAKPEQPEDWTKPFDAPTQADVALADDVAQEISALIGTRLPSGKLVRPGEILVLCRKRDAFFIAVNRALRRVGVPTAGADRIPVSTHISVLDLLALADVLLLPEDDLQLAACLKSPLIGLSEDELMKLAIGRKGSLWRALRDSAEPRAVQAAEKLRGWLASADQVTPFRFFAEVLGPHGGRRAFRERLGGEADSVLDAFLSQALAYESLGPPTLQGFAGFLRASHGDIKRESDEASTGVRVMTVHGAKGLEADVVFLVDTGGRILVNQHRNCLVKVGDADAPAFLWRRSKDEATALQRAADVLADRETENEYLRLLYVGMTRARDVLYVCGIKGVQTPAECWYGRVADALVAPETERDPESGELAAPYVWPQPCRPPLEAKPGGPNAGVRPAQVPDWLFQPAPSPLRPPEPLRPSRALAEPDPRVRDADPAHDLQREPAREALLRGSLVHRLLQTLPGLSGPEARAQADRLLARELGGATRLADEIRAEAEAVLGAPDLAMFFGPESRAEVPIVGRLARAGGDYAVSGQIDRLLRTDRGWRILDFKTNRTVPDGLDEVPPDYLLQLALYRRLLLDLQPGSAVDAAIVWTAGPKLMPIPAASMERALAKLGIETIPFP